MDFRYQRKYEAQNGQNGMKYNKYGKQGDNLVIKVPPEQLSSMRKRVS